MDSVFSSLHLKQVEGPNAPNYKEKSGHTFHNEEETAGEAKENGAYIENGEVSLAHSAQMNKTRGENPSPTPYTIPYTRHTPNTIQNPTSSTTTHTESIERETLLMKKELEKDNDQYSNNYFDVRGLLI